VLRLPPNSTYFKPFTSLQQPADYSLRIRSVARVQEMTETLTRPAGTSHPSMSNPYEATLPSPRRRNWTTGVANLAMFGVDYGYARA
jgi:hypothetical protein